MEEVAENLRKKNTESTEEPRMMRNRSHSARVTDMTKGRAGKLIMSFSLPLIFGNLFQQLYAIADAVVVGRYVGVDALASVGCISWVCWLINAFLRDCANAVSIAASIRVGDRNEKEFRVIVANSAMLCVILGIPVMAALLWMTPVILRLLSVQPNIIHMTRQYLTVFILTIPIGLAHSITTSLLRAYGNSSVTFFSMTVSNITNIVLDLVFVLVFGWGVLGAAVATWIAQFLAMAVALAAAAKESAFHIGREDLHLEPALLRELGRLWAPMLFNSLVISMGGLFVEKHTNQIGSSFTAGIAACGKVFGMLEAVIMAVQTGVSVYVGQNLGARQFRRIRDGLLESVRIGFVLIIAMVLAVFAAQDQILPLFLSSQDPEAFQRAFQVASTDAHIIFTSMLIMTPMYLHRVTIQTLGFPEYATLAGVMQLIMRVLTIVIGPGILGEYAYFIPETMAWTVSLPIVAIPCYRYLKKKIAEEEKAGAPAL